MSRFADGDSKLLRDVIVSRFNSRELETFLSDHEIAETLEMVSSPGTFPEKAFDAIKHLERSGLADRLLNALRTDLASRQDLLPVVERIQSRLIRTFDFDRNFDGAAVVSLCDRSLHERALYRGFTLPPNATNIFLLPGDEKAAHDLFLQKFRHQILPELLRQPATSLADITHMVIGEPVSMPPQPGEMEFVLSKLSYELDPSAEISIAAFRAIPHLANKIVLIQHDISVESAWGPEVLQLIEQYARFWSLSPDQAQARPWFVIFLNIIFPVSTTEPVSQLEDLKVFLKQFQCDGCTLSLLPFLPPVTGIDVKTWVKQRIPDRITHGDKLISKLFANTKARPFGELTADLEEFAKGADDDL